jgi:transmembrane sensor
MKKQDQIHIIVNLIDKFREGGLSQAERQDLDTWLAESEENRSLFTALTDKDTFLEKLHSYSKGNSDAMWQKTQELVNPGAKVISLEPSKRVWWKYTAAAAVVAILATGAWFYSRPVKQQEVAQQKDAVQPLDAIVPGSSKAILTLADGKNVELNDAGSQAAIKEGDIIIVRTSGRLIYNNGESGANGRDPIAVGSSALYNTVSTPKGGQYQVTLPDGTVVWLNAASSLRFPIAFAGSERNVLLTGEAFFEVKKMHDKPFKVRIKTPLGGDGGLVEVLGTHFNVNAYTDEPFVRTTLVEGSVKVTTGTKKGILKPGQAANVALDGGLQVLKQVDVESATAWKEGFFSFKGASAQVIMQQVARWYNLDVAYTGNVPAVALKGNISRDYTIDQILEVLETSGIKTKLDRKTRTVTVI